MCISTNTFNVDTLNNYFTLRRFLSGDRQIQELTQKARTPYAPPSVWHRTYTFSKEVALAPVTLISLLFTFIISSIAKGLKMESIHRWASLKIIHLKQDLREVYDSHDEQNFIPSRNCHKLDTCDFYAQSSIAVSSIQDQRVRISTDLHRTNQWIERQRQQFTEELQILNQLIQNPGTIPGSNQQTLITRIRDKKALALETEARRWTSMRTIDSTLNFYHQSGVCGGSTSWFNYLYLKTRHLFTNPWDHARYLAKYFEKGAPREAALLQTLSGVRYAEIPGAYEDLIDLRRINTQLLSIRENENLLTKTREKIMQLPAGVYSVTLKNFYTSSHGVSLIKIDAQKSILLDTNKGLFFCEGEAGFQIITERFALQRVQNNLFEIHFDEQQLSSFVSASQTLPAQAAAGA